MTRGRDFIDRLSAQRHKPELYVPCPACRPGLSAPSCVCRGTRKILRAERRQLQGASA